jgi:hypothetical protein
VILLYLFTGWYRTRRPIHCDHYWSIMLPHLNFNHSWFTQQSYLPETAEETWREMSVNYSYEYPFHIVRILTCRKIIHGIISFTSPLKKVVLWICIALKYPLSSAVFEPADLGSNAKHDRHWSATSVEGNRFQSCSELEIAKIWLLFYFHKHPIHKRLIRVRLTYS